MMMTRAISFVALGLGLAALAGCPVYSDDHADGSCYNSSCDRRCWSSDDCASGQICSGSPGYCYTPGNTTCSKPSDCASGQTCGANRQCVSSDCSTVGCASPYVCQLSDANQGPVCVLPGNPPPTPPSGTCKSDNDCPSPAGSKCLSGSCVAPSDLCTDATQCAGGSQCVNGACIPSCTDSKQCPTGYACDTARGICTNNPDACTTTKDCTGSNVCVQSHCVAPCGANDACQSGLICVDGGCVPDQKPVQTCDVDGKQDKCREGSICLHHSCYISCESTDDAGADAGADACKSADNLNVCKSVTTSSGVHAVCGSDKNLGSECDPTQGKNCASGLVCIDGYCR